MRISGCEGESLYDWQDVAVDPSKRADRTSLRYKAPPSALSHSFNSAGQRGLFITGSTVIIRLADAYQAMPAHYQEGRLVQVGLCWAYLPQDEMLKDMPYYGGCGDLHFTTAHQVALHVALTTRRE